MFVMENYYLTLCRLVIVLTMSILSFVQDPLTTSNGETFIPDFFRICRISERKVFYLLHA